VASVDSLLPGDEDILQDITIRKVASGVFIKSAWRIYSRLFSAELVSVGNEPVSVRRLSEKS
jgi:hypothetical protein